MELFDNHAHYNDEKFNEDRDEILKHVYESGVTKLICAGYNVESSKKAIEISKQYDFVYTICGISPNDIPDDSEDYDDNYAIFKEQLNEIEELSKNEKVVAIGEIGLDYYWNTDNKEFQRQTFVDQIKLANKLNLPIVIHSRDAVYDTLDILKNVQKVNKPSVFHCCQLNVDLVREALKLGFYISFAGPITFKNSKNASDIVNMVPVDKILIETDSPYLAPEPVRGTRNNSANVQYVLAKIAEFKNMPIDVLAEQVYSNTLTVYGI